MLYGFGDDNLSASDAADAAADFTAAESLYGSASSSSGTGSGTSFDWTKFGTTALDDVANVVSAAFGLKRSTPVNPAAASAAAAAAAARNKELLTYGALAVGGLVTFLVLRRR